MVCACHRCTLKLMANTNHKFPVNGSGEIILRLSDLAGLTSAWPCTGQPHPWISGDAQSTSLNA